MTTPALPEPHGHDYEADAPHREINLYTEAQVLAYAAACVAAETEGLRAHVALLKASIEQAEAEADQLAALVKALSDAMDALAERVEALARAAEYYRAGLEHRPPKWVPSRITLPGPLRGDYPIGHLTFADAGDYYCQSNRYGAVSVLATNGRWLGVKPDEFEPLEWRENTRAALTQEVTP